MFMKLAAEDVKGLPKNLTIKGRKVSIPRFGSMYIGMMHRLDQHHREIK
jgi:hypothetical protein